jgi:hypothetical protein
MEMMSSDRGIVPVSEQLAQLLHRAKFAGRRFADKVLGDRVELGDRLAPAILGDNNPSH